MSAEARSVAAARILGVHGRTLVLASASVRRREILASLGLVFETRAAAVDETLRPGADPADEAVRLAEAKARAAARPGGAAWVVGADTLVVVDGEAMGKPRDRGDAARMLRALSGRRHEVVTGVAVIDEASGASRAGAARTRVAFSALSDEDREALLDGAEWPDKAGAYAIQGLAGVLIDSLDGDYFNVVGLPIALLRALCRELGGGGLSGAAGAAGEGRT